ncbi:hypothetical protein Alsa1_CDS0171 [Staphylococcus phage Alsa_1]|nr:hypothetical protein Alsa1_CDS0171 [Staphylococcus phage Alsa_1]WNM50994.1 hypothetical protein Alsa3_CDS0125 [Staphylococcus phage Alsa_3]WNM51251.1 hypothetical protein Alsa4_CDS0121 [Staphylococcus phage Alsa_4]WNM56156.1 hypothetical protein CoNPh38_CDS0280 [Staphylococcus phage S-CoN_Ph38]
MAGIDLAEVFKDKDSLEISDKDFQEFMQPFVEHSNKVKSMLEHKNYDIKKLLNKHNNYLDTRLPNIDYNDRLQADVLLEILVKMYENNKYDYPPFYEIDSSEISYYFKTENKEYKYYIDDYNEIIEGVSKKDKVKYIIDIDKMVIEKRSI